MTGGVRRRPVVELGGPALGRAWFPQICSLYTEVFAQPPFVWSAEMAARHRVNLVRLVAAPSFGIAVARSGSALVGFGYGARLPVDHGWWTGFRPPLPDAFTREWEGRTFGLIDLAVRAEYRGRGVGGDLLRRLLSSRSEARAALSVQPTADRTQAIYRHLGWHHVGRKGPTAESTPPFWDIYVRDL